MEKPNMGIADSAFENSVRLFADVAVGICTGVREDGKTDEIGYFLIMHPQLACPVAAMLSRPLIDNLITGLNIIRDQVTCDESVTAVGDYSVN